MPVVLILVETGLRSVTILAMEVKIEGQLSPEERALLVSAVCSGDGKPNAVLEVGTWLGGGSTARPHALQILFMAMARQLSKRHK